MTLVGVMILMMQTIFLFPLRSPYLLIRHDCDNLPFYLAHITNSWSFSTSFSFYFSFYEVPHEAIMSLKVSNDFSSSVLYVLQLVSFPRLIVPSIAKTSMKLISLLYKEVSVFINPENVSKLPLNKYVGLLCSTSHVCNTARPRSAYAGYCVSLIETCNHREITAVLLIVFTIFN